MNTRAASVQCHAEPAGPAVTVVDDCDIAREYYRRLLRRISIEVRDFADPLIALAEIRQRPGQMLFVDHCMPRLEGIDMLEQLAASRSLGKAGTYLCTASMPMKNVVDRAESIGVQILVKDRLLDRDWVRNMIQSTLRTGHSEDC